MADERGLLREHYQRLLENDKDLRNQVEQLRGLANNPELKPVIEKVRDRVSIQESLGTDSPLALETIVLRVGRPVLEVAHDDYVIEGPEAAVWEARLQNTIVRAALRQVIPAVGRVEVDNHPELTWVGTAWLIADDIVVTNRHVASEFAALSTNGERRSYVFRRGWPPGSNTRMAARIDFRRELRDSTPRAFAVHEVLHIEDDDGPDFALLRIEKTGTGGALSAKLQTSQNAEAQQYICTVGYPAADSRIPEHELMSRLFSDKYNVKRLAPGQVQGLNDDLIMHDCTTLGGNSGSPIIDIATGNVIGLHFSGVFLRENRGVPIQYVVSRLQKLNNLPSGPEKPRADNGPPNNAIVTTPAGEFATLDVSLTVPLKISVGRAAVSVLNGPINVNGALGGTTRPEPKPTSEPRTIEAAVAKVRAQVKGKVLNVRDGFLFRNGWITSDAAVVVILENRTASLQELGLPAAVDGFPIDVRVASPWDIAEAQAKLETLEGLPHTTYKKPNDLQLEEVDEEMTVTCHVSPDAGWPILRDFLKGTKKTLTVGMYDFTAPHIVDGVLDAVRSDPRKLTLVLQEGEALTGKPDDIPEEKTIQRYQEELDSRLDYAPASIGKDHQFASAYHIKVAVRDGKSFWLSSGNWQSSNQPNHEIAVGESSWDLLMGHNREWHAVIENVNLARQFEKYLLYDLKNAKADAATEALPPPEAFFLVDEAVEERVPTGTPTYFKPLKVSRRVRVRPLLTPDNYQEQVLALINTAERRLLFQNQSLSLLGLDPHGNDKNDPRFSALADAMLAKQHDGVDVRIIIRGEFAPVGPLEQLKKRGFDMSKVRLQNRCHTKGIVVDGVRVLIGSHNWTNQGTLVNRDASLIFEDEDIAKYFEEIFWFDWKNLTRQSVSPRRTRRANDDEAVPSGMRLVSWQEIVNGD